MRLTCIPTCNCLVIIVVIRTVVIIVVMTDMWNIGVLHPYVQLSSNNSSNTYSSNNSSNDRHVEHWRPASLRATVSVLLDPE